MATLNLSGLTKTFGPVHALSKVTLTVGPGEVRGLVGENGSGKTTLIRCLAGELTPEHGTVTVNGAVLGAGDARQRVLQGVGVVYQEPRLCQDLSIGENLYMGRLPRRARQITWHEVRRRSVEVLARVGLHLDPDTPLRRVSQDEQHMIEVARVLALNCSVIAFDETTASLTGDHVARLFTVIRGLKQAGAAMLFVSHRLEEIYDICDSITVLRDGAVSGQLSTDDSDQNQVVRLMVGRSLEGQYFRPSAVRTEPVLQVKDLRTDQLQDPVNLTVHRGEVLGVAGLVGSGRTTLLRSLFGLQRRTGTVTCAGQLVPPGAPRAAIIRGLGFVPEDRRAEGLAVSQSVRANASSIIVGSGRALARPATRAEQEVVTLIRRRLSLKAASDDVPAATLSGGNQQKIVLGRWLARRNEVLLLDEPTRGIDIGAKREIYDFIHELALDGLGIIMVSSELPELMGLCDRIIVMREGKMVAELPGDALEEDIALAMAGPVAVPR